MQGLRVTALSNILAAALTQDKAASKISLHPLEHRAQIQEADVIVFQGSIWSFHENGIQSVLSIPWKPRMPVLTSAIICSS